MMTLKEFFDVAFKSRLYKVLTKKQAQYLSIPYPLVSGWMERYSGVLVPDVDKMVSLFTPKQKKKCRISYKEPVKVPFKLFLPDGQLNIEYVLSEKFYSTSEWRKLRYKVISESDGKCCLCGRCRKDGLAMHVDHIKPRSIFPLLALTESNLQVLCEDCNKGKGNTDCRDWR